MITVQGLSYSYNGTRVLKDLSFSVKRGEFLGILGPNGSGKTTLLRCLNRTNDVPEGRILLDGRDLAGMRRRDVARTVATVAQETGYDFEFTVEEVVSMGRYPHLGRFEFEKPSHRAVVRRAMEYTKTWPLRSKPVTRISGGERQRVMIARALAQEPRLLLLDEPTKDLDIRHALDIMELIKSKNASEGLTVIGVFHDLDLALRYCTRVLLLRSGRVFALGPTADVLTPKNIERVFGVKAAVERGHVAVLG